MASSRLAPDRVGAAMTPAGKALLEPRTEAGKELITRYWHLVDLREEVVAIEAEAAQPDVLRAAVENLLANPVFVGDEGFEPTLQAVSAGHLHALRAALAANPPAATEPPAATSSRPPGPA